jgi:putative ABC transport system permease protein
MKQIVTIMWMNLRNIRARMGASLVSMFGIAGVVLVVVAVLAMAEGFRATLEQAGSDDVAVVLRSGTSGEMSSVLAPDDVRIVGDAPGIMTGVVDGESRPMTSAELFVTIDLPKRATGTWANAPMRGIEGAGAALRPKFKLITGRMFELGKNEAIVGVGAARAFAGLDMGATIQSGNAQWKVVGIFSDGGSASESEMWTDARVLQGAFNRGSSFQSLRAKLVSPAAFNEFRDRLTTDRRLSVMVETERQFLSKQSETLTTLIRGAGFGIAILMGVGAIFGALNTMYSSIAARAREIATLRALGFGPWPIMVSVLTEAMVLAMIGGLLGGIIAYVAFNGYQASTLNFQSFSQVTFAFAVTPALLLNGLVYALLLGLIGGVPPAWRAIHEPIVDGLRSV